eukprot:CAMPEP_0182871514 /NCGR_PEP_ID=MMETSP0034_2-20130328/11171_1 /TAXON_ID=156128 /ORGANISM="Nephroselmis pyriformis, Strain CCMP717" /LENGTH=219 /DNA_ID=CAMNT_0025004071 /DNA_START=95 /DNA_END=751 /DNA_ORIENTATION=+
MDEEDKERLTSSDEEEATSSEEEESSEAESEYSEGDEEDAGATYEPRSMWSFGASSPVSACCMAMLAWLVALCLFLGLAVGLGSKFWRFDPHQRLVFTRDGTYARRLDAVLAGRHEAEGTFAMPASQLQQSMPLEGPDGEQLSLELLYLPKAGDVFELAHLEKIMEIENYIMGHRNYRSYCLLAWTDSEILAERASVASGARVSYAVPGATSGANGTAP